MALGSPGAVLLVLVSMVAAPVAVHELAQPEAAAPLPPEEGPVDEGGGLDRDVQARLFEGQVRIPDPTGKAFGRDALLWTESCLVFDHAPANPREVATLRLIEGATGGEFEDLDLYFWDAQGRMITAHESGSEGIGVHHSVGVPSDAAAFSVCLVDGANARFHVEIA